MTWIKLEDTCPDHPALVGLSDAAFAAWVRGLCYSSRHLTDGFLPDAALKSLGSLSAARELQQKNRWVPVEGGVMIHDYLDVQRSREQVQNGRAVARERQRRHRSVTSKSRRDTPVSHAEVTLPEVEESRGETEKVKTSCSSATNERPNHGPAFDAFWTAYPRKVGKPKAKTAFVRLLRSIDAELIIAGARRYADDPNREEAFTAMPTTWLNRHGWDDPPLPARTTTKAGGNKRALGAFLDRTLPAAPRPLGLNEGTNP